MSKEKFLSLLRRLGACPASVNFVRTHPSDNLEDVFDDAPTEWVEWLGVVLHTAPFFDNLLAAAQREVMN